MNAQDHSTKHALFAHALAARITAPRSTDRATVVAQANAAIQQSRRQLADSQCTGFTGIFHSHDTVGQELEVSARCDAVSSCDSLAIDKLPLLSARMRHLPRTAVQWLRIKLLGRDRFCQAVAERAMRRMALVEAALVAEGKLDAPKGWNLDA